MDILEALNGIFRKVFDDNTLEIRPVMTANDIDNWDSLTHINLIIAVESHFNVKFNQGEISSLKTVLDLINALRSKLLSD